MLETTDFFETQIKQCRDSAARSSKKNDREFWLKMANRWEGLLQARRLGDATADPRAGARLGYSQQSRWPQLTNGHCRFAPLQYGGRYF